MPWTINEEECTGCGLCSETDPDVFELDEDAGLGKVKDPKAPKDKAECIQAAEDCPAECVIWAD